VLLVDDHVGDITWLMDYLEFQGYEIAHVTNEEAARKKLEAVKARKTCYSLAIIDIMVSVKDIMDLVKVSDGLYEDSQRTGIRLCKYARRELGIPAEELPIVCISARADDEEFQEALGELGIKLFSRVPQTAEESLREYLKENLPKPV
jgi:CheY-like chemotaxis protein